jgi:hypothetical protein
LCPVKSLEKNQQNGLFHLPTVIFLTGVIEKLHAFAVFSEVYIYSTPLFFFFLKKK